MRPFSTLGVAPFLIADSKALEDLHKRFLEKSLELHPDRLPAEARVPGSPEAMLAEEKSAELNVDYADLKNTDRLIKRVLMDTLGPPTGKSSLPPSFAAEYFEFQEKVEALNLCLGQSLPEDLRIELNTFRKRIEEQKEIKTLERNSVAKRFSYSGTPLSTNSPPWTMADLEQIQKIDFEIRFFNQFLNDLTRRYG